MSVAVPARLGRARGRGRRARRGRRPSSRHACAASISDSSSTATDELSASVRTRLHAHRLGRRRPASNSRRPPTCRACPDDAITLLPDGTLRKAVTVLANLATPATPWRLPSPSPTTAASPCSCSATAGSPRRPSCAAPQLALPPLAADAEQTAATRAPVRTGAAAFVLLELAKRHPQLFVGLCGATRWRSVAQQLVAAGPATRRTRFRCCRALWPSTRAMRPPATLCSSRATRAPPRPNRSPPSSPACASVEAEMGDARRLAGAAAARALQPRGGEPQPGPGAGRLARASPPSIGPAPATNDLLEQLALPATTSGELAGLAGEIAPAAWILAAIVARESDPNAPVPDIEPTSLLGHYERACLRVLVGDTRGALADLELAATNARLRDVRPRGPLAGRAAEFAAVQEDRGRSGAQDSCSTWTCSPACGPPCATAASSPSTAFRALTPGWLHAETRRATPRAGRPLARGRRTRRGRRSRRPGRGCTCSSRRDQHARRAAAPPRRPARARAGNSSTPPVRTPSSRPRRRPRTLGGRARPDRARLRQDGCVPTRLLFVCSGNICRSPTAEAVMRHLVEEAGLADEIEVDGAGHRLVARRRAAGRPGRRRRRAARHHAVRSSRGR